MSAEENIKVAVRLRPFLPTIKDEADGKARRIIRMDELSSSISITNPSSSLDVYKFTFDNILWSFDGYSEQVDGYLSPENKAAVSEEIFCDQKQVYEEVGKEMVQNLWNGYNSTIFTFGESRSGKSWTLLGLGANKGIVPQALTELFKGVREKEKSFQQNGSSIEVRFSMAEIYNERVKDLLAVPSSTPSTKFKSTIKIREHSRKGFYIEGLRTILIVNHEDIQQRLEEGLTNRAVFLTNVNATSSNSMTVISLTLVQKIRNHRGDEVTRMATLEFVDLPACGLKASKANADEDYTDLPEKAPSSLKQNGINSLSICVDMLLEASIGKGGDIIPFHDHSVTKMMKNALRGNTKSYMIVTLSPSDTSFHSSLFAVQFAEKVRMLSTRAVINEEVTVKLLRELKAENDKLRKLISLGEVDSNDFSNRLGQSILTSYERETIKRRIGEDMRAQIRENEKEVRNLQQPFDERLKPFKTEKNDLGKKLENDTKNKIHLVNLNPDSQISGRIAHTIPLGTIEFGQANVNIKGKENNHFICFCGPGIREHHGTFVYNSKDGKFSIKPAGSNCRLLVNETPIQFDTVLANNDRIILGGNQVWVYQNPKEAWLEKYASYRFDYDYVMEEAAIKSDLFRGLHLHDDSEMVQKQALRIIPTVEEAKVVSEDLSQNYTFQLLLRHPVETLFKDDGGHSQQKMSLSEVADDLHSEILIKVQNSLDGIFHYCSTDTFLEKLEVLKGSYMQFLEEADIPLKEVEAFKERPDMDVPIGYSVICLKPLAYLVNIETTVPILDYISFQPIGSVKVSLNVCNEAGEDVNDSEVLIESPDELLDENLTVNFNIQNPEKIGILYKDIFCKYKFLDEEQEIMIKLDSKTPNFIAFSGKHEKKFVLGPVTDNTLNLILTQYLTLRFFGKQRAHKLLNLTRNSSFSPRHDNFANPVQLERTMAQLKLKEKVEQRHQMRLNALKTLVDQSETLGEESVPLSVMKSLFDAKSKKLVDQSLEDHKESLTAIPVTEEAEEQKQLPPELKALKRFSEVCSIF